MKRLWALLLLLVIGVTIIAAPAANAQDTQNFVIKSFEADYFLNRNAEKTSVLNVIEQITAEFPDFDQNHGILRAIPKSYRGHTVSLSIESVKNDQGQSVNYTTYEENDNLVLKIGDADRYVRRTQTYVIRYSLRNVALILPNHEEFYWDVNGNQWPQNFEKVSARVHIREDLALNLQDRQICYAGPTGQNDSSGCSISREVGGDETVVSASANRQLKPYETLTVALGFNGGTFVLGPEIAREELRDKIKLAAAIAAIAIPPAVAFGLMYHRWRRFGDDPTGRGVIIPEYEPPKGFNVLTSDYLLHQKMRNDAFSAAIVELAVKRYLTIFETKEHKKLRRDAVNYELELSKDPAGLPKELKKIVDILFDSGKPIERIKLSEIKKSIASRKRIYEQMKKLEKDLADGLFKSGHFIKDPHKVRNSYLLWATGLFAGGAFGLFIWPLTILGVGVLLAAAVVLIFAFIMPARSHSGVTAHDALLGLRDYIKLAETERLKFLQSPEGAEKIKSSKLDPLNPKAQVKLFEELLPYAMLFGLEKQWAKQFENIYKKPPDWYHGNWTAFNVGCLTSSLGGFSSVSSVTFSSPSSSGGSGFSGGSSGGGGGGGGGGGW